MRHWWDPYQLLGKQSKLEVKGWGLALGNRAHLRLAKKSEKRSLQITGSSGIEQRLFTLKYVAKKKRVGSDKKNVTFKYYLYTGDSRLQECRHFFPNTLYVGRDFNVWNNRHTLGYWYF